MKLKRSALIFVATLGASFTIACSFFTPRNVRTTLDVAETACVLAMDWFGEDYQALAKVCHIAEEAIPEVRRLVSAKHLASKAKGAPQASRACPSGAVSESTSGSTSAASSTK